MDGVRREGGRGWGWKREIEEGTSPPLGLLSIKAFAQAEIGNYIVDDEGGCGVKEEEEEKKVKFS